MESLGLAQVKSEFKPKSSKSASSSQSPSSKSSESTSSSPAKPSSSANTDEGDNLVLDFPKLPDPAEGDTDDELPPTLTQKVKVKQEPAHVIDISSVEDGPGARETSPICIDIESSDDDDMYADPDPVDENKSPASSPDNQPEAEEDELQPEVQASALPSPSKEAHESPKASSQAPPATPAPISRPHKGATPLKGPLQSPAQESLAAPSATPAPTPKPRQSASARSTPQAINQTKDNLPTFMSFTQPPKKPVDKTEAFRSLTQPRSKRKSEAFGDSISSPGIPRKDSKSIQTFASQQVKHSRESPVDEVESDDQGPKKKRRTSSTVAKTPPYTNRHPEYWHMDGNLVVRVDGVHFKLHRSRMVRNSTFFKEQVAIARAEMDMFRHDHIFVQVKGVSVQDFERLLEALDVGVGYVFNPPPFHIIASVLRAARTLGFTTLEAWATHTLRNMWPESYEGITSTPIQHGAETIGIARDCNIPSLLKPAFYQLVRTTAFGQNLDEEEEENQEDAKRRTLKRQDLIRLVRMREGVHIAWVEAADSPPSKALFPCPLEVPVDRQDPASDNVDQTTNSPPVDPIKNKCLKARANSFQIWHAEVKESGIFEEHLYDPIVGLDKLSKIKWEDHGFCEGCVKSWRNHWELEKKRIWDRMDITLELHPSDVVES